MYSHWVEYMKEHRLSLRISIRRMDKFRQYATDRDKTLTQIIEDFIDSLPNKESLVESVK